MSRLQEYNPEFGVVFDEYDDWLNSLKNGGTGGGGTKPPAGTPPATTGAKPGAPPTFSQQSNTDKGATQLATGWKSAPPAGAMQIGPGSVTAQGITWHQDPNTLNWSPGYPTTKAEGQLAINASRPGGTIPGTTPTTVGAGSTNPFAGLSQLSGQGALANYQGPTIPGLDAYRQPGIGFPEGNNKPIGGVSNGLNTITGGRQGSMTQFPVGPGFRGEGQYGNNINFANGSTGNGSTGNGQLEPSMLFPDTSVTPVTAVPGSYSYGLGNIGDSNRAYSVPFNIGSGGAALMNIAGNNVQLSSADKGTGYGFALNAMPSSNVFSLTGRNPSEDPASQAAQSLMLHSAIAQGQLPNLMATNPNQFGGFHAGTGNNPFSGNGGTGQSTLWSGYTPDPVAQMPQPPTAASGRASYDTTPPGGVVYGPSFGPAFSNLGGSTTNVPAYAPGAYGPAFGNDQQAFTAANAQAQQAFAAAQAAQAEKDKQDAAGGFGGDYSPFERYATGGNVATGPLGGGKSLVTNEPMILVGMFSGKPRALMGEDNGDPGNAPNKERLTFSGANNSQLNIKPLQPFATGGDIATGNPNAVVGPPDPGQIKPSGSDQSGLYGAVSGPPDPSQIQQLPTSHTLDDRSTGPVPPNPFDPMDPNILTPWQQAQQQNAARDANIRNYDYRRTFAGRDRANAVQVTQGDVPNAPLPAGSYYSTADQVNRVIGNIQGAQDTINALGPAEDTNPMYGRVGDIGTSLQRYDRLRSLELERTGEAARDDTERASALTNYQVYTAQYSAALQGFTAAQQNWNQYAGAPQSPEQAAAYQAYLNAYAKVQETQANQVAAWNRSQSNSPQLQALDSQIADLNNQNQGTNESSLRTELAQINQRLGNQQQRVDKTNEVQNLARLRVPSLNQPISSAARAA